MFAYLRGQVVWTSDVSVPGRLKSSVKSRGEFAPVEVWLEVQGVGYSILTAPSIAKRIKGAENQTLYISQSSALYGGEMTLYGFAALAERKLFELLRNLPGVGAKKALEYFEKISAKSWQRFIEAVIRGDNKLLSNYFGFSSKTAAKMLAELREKAVEVAHEIGPKGLVSRDSSSTKTEGKTDEKNWVDGGLWEQARMALLSLGFASSDAEAALNEVVAGLQTQSAVKAPTIEDLVKKALQELAVVS